MKTAESFLNYLKNEKRSSPLTVRAYHDDLLQFRDFSITTYSQEDLSKLSHLQIRSWIVSMMEDGLSARSVNRKLSTLRSFYRFLKRDGKLSMDPMKKIQGPKTSKQLPEFVDEERMELFFDPRYFNDDFEGWRDRAMLEFFYATGVRRAELINLNLAAIDMNQQTVKVLGKRSKERIIPLNNSFIETLKQYLVFRSQLADIKDQDCVFLSSKGKKLNPRTVYSIVNQHLEKVTTLKKKSPHVLRHTFATHLLNHGADLSAIKELLGHANLSATQIYTHNSISKLQEIYQKSHPRS